MLPWIFLGAAGLVFFLGLARLGLAAARNTPEVRRWPADLLLLASLMPVALFAVHPYIGVNLVGAGDSYHYGLQVADFITQARHGVMPILAGQSDYAFNGNIHTLRTAPYFTHLAGLLDGLTGRRLSFVSLQNLTVTTTSVLAAWAAALAVLRASGGRRIIAGLLASIYVLSPAIMGPLALHDMFATYMAAPWLVLCWYGLAEILRRENDLAAQLLAAGALALVWYAHSPLGAWLSLVWALVQLTRIILVGGCARQWLRSLTGVLFFAGLSAYAFLSIATLGSGPESLANYDAFVFSSAAFQQIFQAQFSPFLGAPALPGIQLGWMLWLLLVGAGGLCLWRRQPSGLFLLLFIVALAAFMIPVPGLTEAMWRALPERLVTQTNWPAQRLCPLLASGIVIVAALALRLIADGPGRAYRVVCVLLAVGAVWSAAEVAAIHRRPGVAKLPPAIHDLLYSPQNLRLTRYSYALFAQPPSYFTHGWTDPEFESRLLDKGLDPAGDNTSAVLRTAGPGESRAINGTLTVDLAGSGGYLLTFDFAHPAQTGEITIRGTGLERAYALPRSGEMRGFGSEPGGARSIPLRLDGTETKSVTIGANVAGVSVRIDPIPQDVLPVRVHGQIPYRAIVRTVAPAWLETPRVHLEGYVANVNGRGEIVRRSPDGLVMVPVPAGESEVVVTYPGPFRLRAAWFLSLGCLAAWPWLLLRAGIEAPHTTTSWAWFRQHTLAAGLLHLWHNRRRTVMLAGILTAVLFAAGWTGVRLWREYRDFGPLLLQVELPKRPVSRAEPLVTIGQTGTADCLYVIYEDAHHVRFGLDHWAYGGPVSDPIRIDFSRIHEIEFSIGGLYPPSRWFSRPALSGPLPLHLKLDGQTIFSVDQAFYPGAFTIGANPVGSSVASARFSGQLHGVRRLPATSP